MEAVSGVDLQVAAGEVVAVVGRNGAGKSTTLLAIARASHTHPTGTVMLGAADLTRATAVKAVRAGIGVVPEGHRVFPAMTVAENLRVGLFHADRAGRKRAVELRDRVYQLFPALMSAAGRPAGQLSGGQQQMLSIGQVLMADPCVLLLDEPSSGLAPAIVDDIYAAIHVLRDEGRGILVVEQNVTRAFANADRIYVMDRGQVMLEGQAADLAADDRVSAIIRGDVA
jgi:branched-chain amino acid transport system ATP-binding protein